MQVSDYVKIEPGRSLPVTRFMLTPAISPQLRSVAGSTIGAFTSLPSHTVPVHFSDTFVLCSSKTGEDWTGFGKVLIRKAGSSYASALKQDGLV
jgi:hypothetical protein